MICKPLFLFIIVTTVNTFLTSSLHVNGSQTMAFDVRKFRPFRWLGLLAAHRRADASNGGLATVLAGIAGCANAGGFLALGHYTSHMTGYLSQLADNVAVGNVSLVIDSVAAISLFVVGAAVSAILINWARQHRPSAQYALPIGLQGLLFFGFAGVGWASADTVAINRVALGLLCFIMGLQNATITKISGARIRTTHATGMITDVGIELGKAVYAKASPAALINADVAKLMILLRLLGVFFVGGVIGALGYGTFGFLFSIPLGVFLLLIAAPQLRR